MAKTLHQIGGGGRARRRSLLKTQILSNVKAMISGLKK